jgi:hypothetical protein
MMVYVSTALSCVCNYIPGPYSHITSRTDTNKGTADGAILALSTLRFVDSFDGFDRGCAVLALYIHGAAVWRASIALYMPTGFPYYCMSHQRFSKQHLSFYTHVTGTTLVDNTCIQMSRNNVSFLSLLLFFFFFVFFSFFSVSLFLCFSSNLFSWSVCWKGTDTITGNRKRGVSINTE